MKGNTHPWSTSLLIALFSASEFSTEWDDLWFPLSIITYKSDFFASYLIELRRQQEPCWIILIILVLSLLWRNNFAKDAMSQNSDPYLTGLSLCAAITTPKSPLNAASILLFLTAASYVLLNDKMGF